MTEKLFYTDSYVREFEATVIQVCENKGKYAVILDRTAFFPESGGQFSDKGHIDGVRVYDVQIVNGEILHYTEGRIQNKSVKCTIDWDERFCKMQNHSGEHIISGIAHKKYGCENVGFHLGENVMTVDFDIYLTKEQLREIEYEANRIVSLNKPIKSYFPPREALEKISYRSKSELSEDVRLVEIADCDICACCAPHVWGTSEVMLIKILNSIRYKGGTRLFAVCGFFALEDYKRRYDVLERTSLHLTASWEDTDMLVEKLMSDAKESKHTLSAIKNKYYSLLANTFENTERDICIIDDGMDNSEMRSLANICLPLTSRSVLVFSGNDNDGYNYVFVSRSIPLKELGAKIKEPLNAKGGGSDSMICGNAKCTLSDIKAFFTEAEYK